MDDHYDECVRVFNGDNNQICVFRYGADPDRRVTAMATARLIAAAPELLAAADEVIAAWVYLEDDKAVVRARAIRNLILAKRKAEGGAE